MPRIDDLWNTLAWFLINDHWKTLLWFLMGVLAILRRKSFARSISESHHRLYGISIDDKYIKRNERTILAVGIISILMGVWVVATIRR